MADQSTRPEYEFGLALDVGRKRKGEPNQDAAEVILADGQVNWHPPLLVVADGLGGHRGGATASKLVIEVFKQQFKHTKHPANYSQLLELCARKAHVAVRVQGAHDQTLSNMGSTVVAVVLNHRRLHLLNVGDSRAYLVHDRKMTQVSQDHSWVGEQVRAGLLTPQLALKDSRRNRLSMAITAKRPEIKTYSAEAALEMDDVVVLCSDGLWGVVPETLIWAAASELSPQQAAEKMVALANSSKGPDNIAVIVARAAQSNRTAAQSRMDETGP